MTAGLRELLELPELSQTNGAPNDDFRQAFRDRISGLNNDLQVMAAQGNPNTHQELDSQRQKLYSAYQTVAAQSDAGSNERVIAAVAKTGETASAQKANTVAGREEWLKRQAEFDAAIVKIGELEDAGHPKAATYRALSDKILAQANARDYQQASAVLDTVEPKLTEAHTLYVNNGGGNAPGGGSNAPGNGGKPSESSNGAVGSEDTAPGPVKQPAAKSPTNGDLANANTGAPNIAADKTLPGPPQTTGTGDGAPRIMKSTGDGQPVSVDEALNEMRKQSTVVRQSGSNDYHRRIWQDYLGNTGEPPVAFKYSNEIRINTDKLTPDQHRQWLELDKAQSPSRYPSPNDPKTPTAQPKKSPSTKEVEKTAPAPLPEPKKAPSTKEIDKTAPALPPAPPAPKPSVAVTGGGTAASKSIQRAPGPQVVGVSLERVSKISKIAGSQVFASSSPQTHQNAWDFHGKNGQAPVAFMVDKQFYVDMSRWPKDLPITTVSPEGVMKNGAKPPVGPPVNAPQVAPKAVTQPVTPSPETPKTSTATSVNLKQLEADAADFARRAEELNKAFEAHEKAIEKGKSTGDTDKLKKQSESLRAEGDVLVKKLAASPEFSDIAGSNSKEILDNARRKGQASTSGGAMGSILKLANAFDWLQDIDYILKASSLLDGVGRAAKVGGKNALGAAQMALFTSITKSTPVGIVLGFVVGMCGDQAKACEEQEEAKRKEEQKKQIKKQAHEEHLAIGRFLKENVPGSVEWLNDHYVIKNQKVWDATVRRVDQMRREHYAKNKAEGLKPFEKMGSEDGLAGLYVQKRKAWDSQNPFFRPEDAVDTYEKSWKVGEARRKPALQRAKDRGLKDGTEGKPVNLEQLWSFPEIDELRRRDLQRRDDGFSFTEAYEPFVESYKQGHRTGLTKAKPRTVKDFKIGLKGPVEKYGQVKLYANVEYSDGTRAVVSDKGTTWSTDDPSSAILSFDKESGSKVVRMMGTANITAQFYNEPENKVYDHTIPLSVKLPVITIVPSAGTYSVGQKVEFVAKTESWPRLTPNLITWQVDRPEIIKIDQNGNAEMLKAGEAVISVTENETSPVFVVAKVKVVL